MFFITKYTAIINKQVISMAFDARTKTLITGEKSGNIKTYSGQYLA